MRRDALVVGINLYPSLKDTHTNIAKHLTTPAADAEAIAQLLEEYGEFRVKRLPEKIIDGKLQVDPEKTVKKEELETAIANLFVPDSSNIPTTALLFFAGHGLRKTLRTLKQGFLALSDASPNKGQWGMSIRDLQDILHKSQVKQQVIWLDCCFSGELLNFNETEIRQQASGRDRFAIAASYDDEVAYQQLDGKHGILSGAILKALDPDKLLGGEWLYSDTFASVVREEIQKYSQTTKLNQPPLFSSNGEVIKLIQGKQDSTKNMSNLLSHNVANNSPVLDTVDMPINVSNFFGRVEELDKLEKIVLGNKCRLISLVGMTGIGKTTLVVKLTEKIQDKFRYIIWKNLRYISSFHVLIDDLVKTFSIHSQEQYNSQNINNIIKYLIDYFQQNKCLLVLDDVSEIMYKDDGDKIYRKGWEEFGEFIQQIIQTSHQTCLILTIHRHLKELNNHRNDNRYYQNISISGLKVKDVKDAYSPNIYCEDQRLDEGYWQQFVAYYGGNPVALDIASKIILDKYDGEISRFFEKYVDYGERHSRRQGYTYQAEEYNIILSELPEEIYSLLDSQFEALRDSEKEIMYLMAIRNEPISWEESINFTNLKYITLINKEYSSFSLLPMVRDYVINRLIHTIDVPTES